MKAKGAFISASGIISALGSGWDDIYRAFNQQKSGIRPLQLFETPHNPPLPSAEITGLTDVNGLPRTHQLARIAVEQAYRPGARPPDAIVVGTTTGGLMTTENLLRSKVKTPSAYRYHSPSTVTECIAKWCDCEGPVITVSTACSSGAVALKIALELIRKGCARRVLAGGVDSLCRLTYHGFNALQLIDAQGARPLDQHRKGMTVGEGATFLMLDADGDRFDSAALLGGGLSCDAYHPTAPHPDGFGALAAMQASLADAGISTDAIDYINLHGTGTLDNDRSEAMAVTTLFKTTSFKKGLPLHSSIKGATGHTLGAAGAMEALVAAKCVQNQWIPGNVGMEEVDPGLGLTPVARARSAPVETVLSNSLGFGGNNAAVVIGPSGLCDSLPQMTTNWNNKKPNDQKLQVLGSACITGAGHTEETIRRLVNGQGCTGRLATDQVTRYLSQKQVRRLQRLPCLALALTNKTHEGIDPAKKAHSIFMGTGWGALSETHRFLSRLDETDDRFPSPTDFIGSVHNAPAGQAAMMIGATGANVTTTGGDVSFEQALLTAGLCCVENRPMLVLGADEAHDSFSPLLDESVTATPRLSDGGGAMLLQPGMKKGSVSIGLTHYKSATGSENDTQDLITALGSVERIQSRFGFILVGMPAGQKDQANSQLAHFLKTTGFTGPIVDYRPMIGEYATASAVAAVLAVRFTANGSIPSGPIAGGDRPVHLNGKGGLTIGLGRWLTVVEVSLQ